MRTDGLSVNGNIKDKRGGEQNGTSASDSCSSKTNSSTSNTATNTSTTNVDVGDHDAGTITHRNDKDRSGLSTYSDEIRE